MRTIQQIFDAVIEAGHYPSNRETYPSSNYMCNALDTAKGRDVITGSEYSKARMAIDTYMDKLKKDAEVGLFLHEHISLTGTLEGACVKTHKSNLAIYKDWKNRPHVRKVK